MGRSITSQRGPLPAPLVRANDGNLTQFSGVVPLVRYMSDKLDIVQRLCWIVGHDGARRVYARHLVLFTFMVGSLVGVHRLAHLEWLRDDAVLLKFLRLPRWPVRKVFSQALAGLSSRGVQRLVALIADVGLAPLHGRDGAVVDMDSSAIVAFGQQEGALFGYSGKGRNRRRHHPLVASVAEIRTVVHADYRDGSGIDAQEAISFTTQALATVRAALAKGARIVLRADSGFWSKPFSGWLLEQGVPFIFAMPLRPAVKWMLRNTRWRGLELDPDIQVTVLRGERLGPDPRLHVIGIRRRVHDAKAPPQGKSIDGCKHWRYQALVTCMDGEPEDMWRFYNDRSDCERISSRSGGRCPRCPRHGLAHRAQAPGQRDRLPAAAARLQRGPALPAARRRAGSASPATRPSPRPARETAALLPSRRTPPPFLRAVGSPGERQPRHGQALGLLRTGARRRRVTPPALTQGLRFTAGERGRFASPSRQRPESGRIPLLRHPAREPIRDGPILG